MTDTVNVPRDAVMAALNRVLPVTYQDGPDYAELTFGDSRTKAMTLEPDTWMALNAIPDLIAAAPKAEPVIDHQDIEDLIADAIGDSIDMDWTSRDGAKAVVKALEKECLTIRANPAPSSDELLGALSGLIDRSEEVRNMLAAHPAMQGREHDSVGVAFNNAIGRAQSAYAANHKEAQS